MTDFDKYVIPVFRRERDVRSFAGTAFLADGYLITAAHVLGTETTFYTIINDRLVALDYSKWLPQQPAAVDKHGYDVAYYPMPDAESGLSLADDDALPGDEVDVVCWQWKPQGLTQVTTRGLVLDEHDERGYSRFSTVDKITHGSSGSPVVKDGKVVGVMAMGRDFVETAGMHPINRQMEQNTCWAYRVTRMRQMLPEK